MEEKEKIELIKQAKKGDKKAIEIIIKESMKLIYSINSKYKNTEDGLQEGMLGVCKAIENWDEKYGVKFSTYAYKYIKEYIKNYYWKEKYGTSLYYSRKINDGKIEYNGQAELLDEAKEDENIDNKVFITSLIEKNCSSEEKELIKKLYYEDKSEKEIAKEMNISIKEVKKLKINILQKLRRHINGGK